MSKNLGTLGHNITQEYLQVNVATKLLRDYINNLTLLSTTERIKKLLRRGRGMLKVPSLYNPGYKYLLLAKYLSALPKLTTLRLYQLLGLAVNRV